MNHPTRLLRWLAPPVRQERDDWTALRAQAAEPLEANNPEYTALRKEYQELNEENQDLKIAGQQRTLIQLHIRVQVILQRCRLYLDTHPTHSVSQQQLPILERILDYVRQEQQYIRQQLLLGQTSLHYLKQLKEATQEIWTKPFCNPNYLLNLLRKIKNDDVHLSDPGQILFLSFSDFLDVARQSMSGEDLPVFARGLETARLINAVSRRVRDWQGNSELLMMAGLLHDFGWLMLQQNKSDLSDDQQRIVDDERGEHPVLGAALLGGVRGFPGDSYLCEIVSQHHERLDGTGYPRRLHTTALGEHARRMAVVCRYLELKNNRRELTADGIRSFDSEEAAFAAALQLYRETIRGEWDQTAVGQLMAALDPNLPEELSQADQHNDPFSLRRFQNYRRDVSESLIPPPHFHAGTDLTKTKPTVDS
ncbi:HD-GYP domain-containing protein [Gimesia fumaroli]|uniref:HD domain protein n=1 Tax=Gimesia fumaroli TaxID=2527976 RepID=A0A518IJZ5_9PLAN|nr:HD domain-containing phosphohydrolase [Gimesia fumaroli]QDV53404.1 HD domain protein [Gimesia fumaroli]